MKNDDVTTNYYSVLSHLFSALDSSGYVVRDINPKWAPTKKPFFYWHQLNFPKGEALCQQYSDVVKTNLTKAVDGDEYKISELWNVCKV